MKRNLNPEDDEENELKKNSDIETGNYDELARILNEERDFIMSD